MINPPAGSKLLRRNVQGHTVIASEDALRHFRRLSTMTLSHIFLQAKEHGSVGLTINDEPWTLVRHPDHTYRLETGNRHHFGL